MVKKFYLFIIACLLIIGSISLKAETLNIKSGWNVFQSDLNIVSVNQFAKDGIVGIVKLKPGKNYELTKDNWYVWSDNNTLLKALTDADWTTFEGIYKNNLYAVFSTKSINLDISSSCQIPYLPIATESYNYQTGMYSIVDLNNLTAYKQLNTYSLGGDIRAYVYGDYIFVVDAPNSGNTSTWYVYKIDQTSTTLDQTKAKTTIANYTINRQNPHSIAFSSDSKAYLTTYFDNSILIFNPQNGNELGTIDLTPYLYTADNGTQNKYIGAEAMLMTGDKLYVSLDRARTYYGDATPDKSMILVIDTTNDTVTKSIKVPYSPRSLQIFGNYLYFLSMGDYSNPIGKIYRINLSDYSLDSNFVISPIVSGSSTEYIKNFVITPEGELFLVTNAGWGQPYNVYMIDNVEKYNDSTKAGLNTTAIYSASGYVPDLDFVCGYLVIADRGKADIDYKTKEVKEILQQGALVFIDTNGKVVKKILDTDLGYPPYKIGSDYNY